MSKRQKAVPSAGHATHDFVPDWLETKSTKSTRRCTKCNLVERRDKQNAPCIGVTAVPPLWPSRLAADDHSDLCPGCRMVAADLMQTIDSLRSQLKRIKNQVRRIISAADKLRESLADPNGD